MQAVILSAGVGIRLRPLTKKMPKVMVPINDKPLLEWHIKHLKRFGIREIFINLHYLPDSITKYFDDGDRLGVNIVYSREKKLLGTGGALINFKSLLNQIFLVLYGDVFTSLNIDNLLRFHLKRKADCTIVVRKTDHAEDSDLVVFGESLRVKKFYFKPHKKLPSTQYGITAIYLFNPEVLKLLPNKTPFDLAKDFLPLLLKHKKRLFCYNTDEIIKDIGTIERYKKVVNLFQK